MVNKVILIGRLGADPELTHTTGDDAVVNFQVATTETWKDKRNGEKREKTQWHRCVAWGKMAEVYAANMKKGKQYYVEGALETTSYEKEGRTHYSTRIKVSEVRFL